jgi:hypothetical protein
LQVARVPAARLRRPKNDLLLAHDFAHLNANQPGIDSSLAVILARQA